MIKPFYQRCVPNTLRKWYGTDGSSKQLTFNKLGDGLALHLVE
ncbi:hypothetical protein [Lysinibacillus fusiformis]